MIATTSIPGYDQPHMERKILFLNIISDDPATRARVEKAIYQKSTYARTLRRTLGIPARSLAVCFPDDQKLPNPRHYAGIILGGAIPNPVQGEEQPWMKKIYRFIQSAVAANVPLLGICGGLQFTVRALGGTIVYNPKGRNMRTSLFTLSTHGKNDPLFKGCGPQVRAHTSHCCIAESLHPSWKLLAHSPQSPFDAIAIGDNVRLLQFHIDMLDSHFKRLVRMRKETLLKEGMSLSEYRRFASSIKNNKLDGERIMRNFVKDFCKIT